MVRLPLGTTQAMVSRFTPGGQAVAVLVVGVVAPSSVRPGVEKSRVSASSSQGKVS